MADITNIKLGASSAVYYGGGLNFIKYLHSWILSCGYSWVSVEKSDIHKKTQKTALLRFYTCDNVKHIEKDREIVGGYTAYLYKVKDKEDYVHCYVNSKRFLSVLEEYLGMVRAIEDGDHFSISCSIDEDDSVKVYIYRTADRYKRLWN